MRTRYVNVIRYCTENRVVRSSCAVVFVTGFIYEVSREEYDIGTPTKLSCTTQNSYEMVSLNNIRCLKSAETDNFNTTYILRMFTITRTNGTR